MSLYHPSVDSFEMPTRIRRLPVDKRGFPVPKFVATINGEPDHRIVNPKWMPTAVNKRRCWICGEPLGRWYVSIIGCMCAVNRVISEPPSHRDCAEFSVQACPFMARPTMHRREAGLPEERQETAGVGLKRNPGVVCLWISRKYPSPFSTSLGRPGVLFKLAEPDETVWYREGRLATREEVASAFYAGIPALISVAQKEGPDAEKELALLAAQAMNYLPTPTVPVLKVVEPWRKPASATPTQPMSAPSSARSADAGA